MQQRLTKFFADAEACVLGTRLHPFTLWHWRELERLQSPLIGDYGEIEFADLSLAVRVCALPPFSRRDPTRVGLFGKLKLRVQQGHFEWQLDSEIAVFLEYLRHYMMGPIGKPESIYAPDGGNFTLKTHPAFYSVCGLLNLGFSVEEAWSQAPGLARWYIVGAAEAGGNEVNIMPTQWIEDALDCGYTLEDCGFGPEVTLADLGIFRPVARQAE